MHSHIGHITSPNTQYPRRSLPREIGKTVKANNKSLIARFPIKQFDMDLNFGNRYKATHTRAFPNIVQIVINDRRIATNTKDRNEWKLSEQTGLVSVHFVVLDPQGSKMFFPELFISRIINSVTEAPSEMVSISLDSDAFDILWGHTDSKALRPTYGTAPVIELFQKISDTFERSND